MKKSSSGPYFSVYSPSVSPPLLGPRHLTVGMFVGGQGRRCRRDLGLKGEKCERRTGVEGYRVFGLDFVSVGEDECGERERRVRR